MHRDEGVLELESLRASFNEALRGLKYPQGPGESLYVPVRYALESGGKRLRPLLVLGSYQWLSDHYHAVGTQTDAMRLALAVEIFHNFSLLHDDLMDGSALRRGRDTVWAKWGGNVAILSGDGMCIYAYEQLEGCTGALLPGILSRFNQLTRGVCLGQMQDMEFETMSEVSLAAYRSMVEGKTAALFMGCMALASHAALHNACEEKVQQAVEEALCASGMHLGIAFQLQDDLLDLYGNTEILGKECGDDLVSHKSTYLSLLMAQRATEEERNRVQEILMNEGITQQEKVAHVKPLYDALGIRTATEEAITQEMEQAYQALERAENLVGEPARVVRTVYAGLVNRER